MGTFIHSNHSLSGLWTTHFKQLCLGQVFPHSIKIARYNRDQMFKKLTNFKNNLRSSAKMVVFRAPAQKPRNN